MKKSTNEVAPADHGGGTPSSHQVAWFEVYSFASRWASSHDLDLLDRNLLLPGTPQWCGMSDDDARKLLALILGGVREALTNDQHQAAMVDASHEIASTTDWSAVARQIRGGRGDAYIPIEKRSA